jgi:homoserine kinase type II
MNHEDITAVLKLLEIPFLRERVDIALAGSPERCLERAAVEDVEGHLWVVQKHDLRDAARKQEIAFATAFFSGRLPEVKSSRAFAPDRFVAEHGGAAWQVTPYVEGAALDRPAYAFEGWRGAALADLLIRFRTAAADISARGEPDAFSLPAFIRDLLGKLGERNRPLFERVYPAVLSLERDLFPKMGQIPTAFNHGDFHPLNVIWSPTGINALIDFEFCGFRPETYDAALLVGCVGMEDPRSLAADLVKRFVALLRAGAGYSGAGWDSFFDLVLALRFAWLSEWLRRDDREMIDLEAVYINLLIENREGLEKAWA